MVCAVTNKAPPPSPCINRKAISSQILVAFPHKKDAVVKIIKAVGVDIVWDIQTAGADVIEKEGVPLPQRVIDSVKRNKIALKSPVTTPIGKGFRSVNVQLRKELQSINFRHNAFPKDYLFNSINNRRKLFKRILSKT